MTYLFVGAPPVSLKHPEIIPEEVKKILDTILPPREFEEDDINWIQHVCKDSADRSQVSTFNRSTDFYSLLSNFTKIT